MPSRGDAPRSIYELYGLSSCCRDTVFNPQPIPTWWVKTKNVNVAKPKAEGLNTKLNTK
jgi:hypothetical protein